MSIDFSTQSRVGRELTEWWHQLQDDRGARAELRRCKSVDEVVMTAAFQRLCFRMHPAFEKQPDRLAAIAGLLSHIERTEPGLRLESRCPRGIHQWSVSCVSGACCKEIARNSIQP